MINIYLVMFCDGYYDSSDHLVAIYTDKQVAIDYATEYDLTHGEIVTVEERCEGVQDCRQVVIVYERKHHDHTEALFSTVCWYDYGLTLSQNQVIAEAVKEASPLITEDVDLDRLYKLYMETWIYEE